MNSSYINFYYFAFHVHDGETSLLATKETDRESRTQMEEATARPACEITESNVETNRDITSEIQWQSQDIDGCERGDSELTWLTIESCGIRFLERKSDLIPYTFHTRLLNHPDEGDAGRVLSLPSIFNRGDTSSRDSAYIF